ncbi:MAG TPA: alpha-glucan family phosphorylase [Methanothrix sp.]|nr:alpha-glucan family phosphorylase [Methanothrix sp.]
MFTHSDLNLPAGLEGLADLALDLRWTVRQTTDKIWELLDAEAWEKTKNPYLILQNVSSARLAQAAGDAELVREISSWQERRSRFMVRPAWGGPDDPACVAYFSMEFGLSEALPIYSGGLGMLAGDFLKTASDLAVPITGIGLLYQQGYFRQLLAPDGSQVEAFPYNDPDTMPLVPARDRDGSRLRVKISLPGRDLILRVWQANVCRVNLYLLDSNDPMNSPWDRAITANLYAPGQERRLIQEIVLGIGGWHVLERLGIEPDVCHLNEGHAAFVVLARAQSFMKKTGCSLSAALWATRAGNVFTTHTPVEAGFDRFDRVLVDKYARFYADLMGLSRLDLMALGAHRPEDESAPFNMAHLALMGCSHVNGVSRLHGLTSRKIFQPHFPRWPEVEVPVGYVTNGVHIPTWDSPPAQKIWEEACPGDCLLEDIDYLKGGISKASEREIWCFRSEARKDLVDYVRRRRARQLQERGAGREELESDKHVLDYNALTLGFARRATAYKRTDLLLSNPERLIAILTNRQRPVQLVMAAKAHPSDESGKEMVKKMVSFAARPEVSNRVVFLEDYDIDLAQHLQPGVDVWINTPLRPNEACGTSGMKVLANGGLNLSSLDGWWDEAYDSEVGWCLGDREVHNEPAWDEADADQLYSLLEEKVVPLFYERNLEGIPKGWVAMVKASMARLTPRFNSARMMREYAEKIYRPATAAYRNRIKDGAKLAEELAGWQKRINDCWKELRFGKLTTSLDGDSWSFSVEVYFGELHTQDVQVELYADPLPEEREQTGSGPGQEEESRKDGGLNDRGLEKQNGPERIVMAQQGPLAGAINGFIYSARLAAKRAAEDFTPRIVPYHEHAFIPLEEAHILWMR